VIARKTLFEKHAHDEEDEEEEYGVDDLNLEGDAGVSFLPTRLVLCLLTRAQDADVWDADSEYLEFLAKEVRCSGWNC
jgi:importin-7